MKRIKSFSKGADGSHWGLSDIYPDKLAALEKALASGEPFDTGWYSSKKHIASARISSKDGLTVTVEVSVSDDFDTEGLGRVAASAPTSFKEVAIAIDKAWDEASDNKKANEVYAGYSLIRWSTEIPEWRRAKHIYPNETRKRYGRKQPQCVDYYIVNATGQFDSPPGDNYHFWGWQNDHAPEIVENSVDLGNGEKLERRRKLMRTTDEPYSEGSHCVEKGIPPTTVKKFEKFANSLKSGSLRIGDWEIKSWD